MSLVPKDKELQAFTRVDESEELGRMVERRPADLRPSEVWNGIATRAEYTWGRTVKFYENLKIVYQIQTTLKEWQQQSEEQKPVEKPDERKLPVKTPAGPGAPAE